MIDSLVILEPSLIMDRWWIKNINFCNDDAYTMIQVELSMILEITLIVIAIILL